MTWPIFYRGQSCIATAHSHRLEPFLRSVIVCVFVRLCAVPSSSRSCESFGLYLCALFVAPEYK
jgi:hypothetical protein